MKIRTTSRIGQLFALALVFLCAGAFTGCGAFFSPITTTTTTNNSGTGAFIYVGKASSTTLAGYVIGTGGTLTAIGSGLSIAAAPTSLVVSPNNQYLYAGTANGIYGYSISTTGTLTALNSGQPFANFPIAAMDISADGNWLVALSSSVALYGPGNLYQLSSSTGAISNGQPMTSSTLSIGSGVAVKFSPTEASSTTSTIAATFGSAGVYTFTFTTNAASVPVPTGMQPAISSTTSDNGLVWNSAGTAIFVASGGSDANVYSYPVVSTTGAISAAGTPAPTGTNPTALSFDKTGSYLYITNSGNGGTAGSTVTGYTVTMSGSVATLAALGSSPYSTNGSIPSAIVYIGNYVAVVNQTGPPDLLLYTVDTTTPGRIYVTGSVSTGLTGGALGTGLALATTH